MSKKRDVKLYFQDILDEIERIKRFVRGIDNFEEFSRNELVYYGRLPKKINATFQNSNKQRHLNIGPTIYEL